MAEEKLEEELILSYLRDTLPEYMVPNVLMRLDNLPLTINGKLARENLPNPNFRENEDNYIASRNELENKICSIWAEVLGVEEEKIGIHDNFFKIGGNSILAIRLITKLNNHYQFHLKVSDIFIHKNIEPLSHKIIQTKPGYQAVVKLNNSYEKPNMFMIHPGEEGCQCLM